MKTEFETSSLEQLDFEPKCIIGTGPFSNEDDCPNKAEWFITKTCGDTTLLCDKHFQYLNGWDGLMLCMDCGGHVRWTSMVRI